MAGSYLGSRASNCSQVVDQVRFRHTCKQATQLDTLCMLACTTMHSVSKPKAECSPTPESVMVSVLLVLSGVMWMYSSGLLSRTLLSVRP